MISYYKKVLYPLQDKVLGFLDKNDCGFYLTGGTALSRGYLGHRYSDDLDLFVNQSDSFVKMAEEVLFGLSSMKFLIALKSDTYYSWMVEDKLKIDLVNDSGKHYGKLISSPLFSKLDNVENILANKLTAIIGRDEPKDVVDIWAIAKYQKINWKKIFTASNSKAVGIFPPNVAQKLVEFPTELLKKIKWIDGKGPKMIDFKNDIDLLVDDMLKVD